MSPWDIVRRLLNGRPTAAGSAERACALGHELLAESSEYASEALARDAVAAYLALDGEGRRRFFDVLARDYSPSPEAVSRAASAWQASPSPEALIRLQRSVEAPRLELFSRLNMAPGGTAALLGMRSELLRGLERNPQWRIVESDLLRLLRAWFNRGFLRLERIDWRTSAAVLEKLARYEAVHAFQGWQDLQRRLQADRRCFGFFHPKLPDEPVIFIEVALTRGLAPCVQPLLDVASPVIPPSSADTAMFYSISSCQEGLRGISLGNLLIKQVVEELRRELPQLRQFATLSPIPGFRSWLGRKREERPQELAALAPLDRPGWHLAAPAEPLQRTLLRLCAYYLLRAKREDGGDSEPLDPVARFHLGNGAALERLNWMGDASRNGIARSAGLMVNYVYRLKDVERNHQLYLRERIVAASSAIHKMARECALGAAPGSRAAV